MKRNNHLHVWLLIVGVLIPLAVLVSITRADSMPSDTTPPEAPFNLTVSDVFSTHASLGWSFRSDDRGITRWELKYKTSGGPISDGDWASASSLPMTQSASPITVGGTVGFGYNEFTPSTTYMFGLKAYDAAGNVSPLAVFPSFTTLAPAITVPAAPTELTAVYSTIPNGPEIQLTVKDNATNESCYYLYWHLSGTGWPAFQDSSCKEVYNSSTWSQPANIGRMQIFTPNAGAGGTYEYQVQACNSAGCSSSNIALVNVPGTNTNTTVATVPNAPSSLRLDPTPSTSAIFLKWNDNSTNEDKFYVDRKFITDTNYAGTLHWAEVSSNAISFSDTNVVSGQHYDYRVQACNSAGCSAYATLSNVVTASTTSSTSSPSNVCTSLVFTLLNNKTSYNTGEDVNYSYKCFPEGTSASSVAIQVVKPDGTPTTYNTGSNVGAVLQQMGFSTSYLSAGSYILRACLNDTSCGAGSVYPLPFTVVGGTTATTAPATIPNSTTVPVFDTSTSTIVPTTTLPQQTTVTTTPATTAVTQANRECDNCAPTQYRWNLNAKALEKCDAVALKMQTYKDIKGDATAQYTNCEPIMNDLENEWKSEKYKARDPRVYGQWYWPEWNATAQFFQYDPAADLMKECKTQNQPVATTTKCIPVPVEDAGWILKSERANYKMYLQNSSALNGGIKQAPAIPMPALATTTEAIAPEQCATSIDVSRQSLASDKQFWQDVKLQLRSAPKDYADADKVNQLLNESKSIIVKADNAIKGKCSVEGIAEIQKQTEQLHATTFPKLSSYLTDLQDRVELTRCQSSLQARGKKLQNLMAKSQDQEAITKLQGFIDEIDSQSKEYQATGEDVGFDTVVSCQDFADDITSKTNPILVSENQNLNKIIEERIRPKLEARLLEQITLVTKKNQEVLDNLYVKIAELQTAVESFSTAVASQISDQVTTSYTALAYVDDETAKESIQKNKDQIIPLVSDAMNSIKTARCVPSSSQKVLFEKLGDVASENWISGEESVKKKLNFLVTQCGAGTMTVNDITAFIKNIDEASRANLAASFEQGLTPLADVATDKWYFGAMKNAFETKVIAQGRPADTTLRQEALLMILRATGVSDADGNCSLTKEAGLSDDDVSPYARCAVNKAIEKGIVLNDSMNGSFVTREELATWIVKLADLQVEGNADNLKPYVDISSVDPAGLNNIEQVIANKIMVGHDTGNGFVWEPKNLLSRAELTVVIEQLINN